MGLSLLSLGREGARLFFNESRCPELCFFSNLNIPPVVVRKLELLNMTVGMVSEVRQLLLSMRKLNLCDTRLLSSRKLASIVLKHRMQMLQCLLKKKNPFYVPTYLYDCI